MEKAKILIVEDEAIIAMEVESQLQSLGYEITSIVDTGEKAIKKAEEDRPDIILMDIRIKGEMDGIDAAEEIRSRFGIPVIFSTAYLDEERIERAKITMPFGYVLKPIQERDLKVTIEMALYVSKVDVERRKAEEDLKVSEKNLRNILDTSLDISYKLNLKTGTYDYLSPSVERLMGFTIEEFIDLGFEKISKRFHPEDSMRYSEHFDNLIAHKVEDEIEATIEYRWKHKDGEYRWYQDSRRAIFEDNKIPTAVIGSVRDITERKLTEEALRISENRYKSLFSNISLGVNVIELRTDKNPHFCCGSHGNCV